ncbi:MAG: hypothetical protein ACK5IP_10675, partial [Paracoccus sp. (in: a-proteobacteria)]
QRLGSITARVRDRARSIRPWPKIWVQHEQAIFAPKNRFRDGTAGITPIAGIFSYRRQCEQGHRRILG